MLKTELMAGLTAFLTMVYIAFVNPSILHEAGLEQGAVFTATCLVTAFACCLTGLFAKAPIGIAPAMALNIYFTYSVVQGFGVPWEQALAMVFVSGLLFFAISATKLRRLFLEAIPHHLQTAILMGISLLIALIVLQANHIIVRSGRTLFQLGDVTSLETGLFFLGFLLMLILDYYAVRAAIVLSILTISLLSLALGLTSWHGLIAMPPSMGDTFLKMDFSNLTNSTALKAMFTFFFIAIFDASGTLLGLFNHPSLRDQPKDPKQLSRTLMIDAAASTLAGALGSSSTSPFIESAAGIQAGGRTGITALVIGGGFIAMLFFYPLAQMIPNFAVGPALLYVSCCMLKNISDLKLVDITETAPCMFTMMMIPFTASIADGIGGGIVLHVLLKWFARKDVHPLTVVLGVMFMVFFIVS